MMMTGEEIRSRKASEAAPAPVPAAALPRVHLAAVLRAIAWKEIRTNWAYAALGWAFWIMISIVIFGFVGRADLSNGVVNLLDQPLMEVVAGFILCGIGFWWGVGSTRQEREFDRWAFLVHRPVSRSWLFAGRVAAAGVLYIAGPALGVIVFVLLCMTRAGGDFFYWRMVVPYLILGIMGVAAYFAGYLVGDRHARFYASRCVPVVAGAAVIAGGLATADFLPALAVVVLGTTVLAAAAWGSALSHGYQLPRAAPLSARLALRTVLGTGFIGILALLSLPLHATLSNHELAAPARSASLASVVTHSEAFVVAADGTLMTVTYDSGSDGKPGQRVWTDEQGHILTGAATQSAARAQQELSFDQQFTHAAPAARPWWDDVDVVRMEKVILVGLPGAPAPPNEHTAEWFYLHRDGIAYGYDRDTHVFLGTLGKSGFAPAGGPRATPFDAAHPASIDNSYYLTFADGIYALDFTTRTVFTLWQPPTGEKLERDFVWQATVASRIPQTHGWNIRITDKHIYLFLDDAHQGVIPRPTVPLDQVRLYVPVTGPAFVLEVPGARVITDDSVTFPVTYTSYDPAGNVLRTRSVERTTRAAGIGRDLDPPAALLWMTAQRGALIAAAAPAAALIPAVRELSQGRKWLGYDKDDAALTQYGKWFTGGVLAGSLMSFAATLVLGLLCRARGKLAWAITAAAFGPAIPLTLLAVHHWPARIRPSLALPTATDVFVSNAAGAA